MEGGAVSLFLEVWCFNCPGFTPIHCRRSQNDSLLLSCKSYMYSVCMQVGLLWYITVNHGFRGAVALLQLLLPSIG